MLGYRSVVRLGVRGVGGVSPTVLKGKLLSTDNSGSVLKGRISYDEETSTTLKEAEYDKKAGYVGAVLLVIGTVIWGYGDLLGLLV